jgi:hypothetical protein
MITAAKTNINVQTSAAAVTKTSGKAHQRETIDQPSKMVIIVKINSLEKLSA